MRCSCSSVAGVAAASARRLEVSGPDMTLLAYGPYRSRWQSRGALALVGGELLRAAQQRCGEIDAAQATDESTRLGLPC